MPDFRYVGWDSVKAYSAPTDGRVVRHLLWGDRVEVIGSQGAVSEVRARHRDRTCFVKTDALNGQPLLEFYFIDVGQGDGTLIVTPERKHILIDGGYPRRKQNTGKSAADFIDWKFFHDYAMDRIELDAMICSHNDEDHYGGLSDLLDVAQSDELDCGTVSVEAFYHAGLSWWRTATSDRTLGARSKVGSRSYFTDLLTSRTAAVNALKADADPKLQGEWGKFIKKMTKADRKDGGNVPFRRLSQSTGDLDDFNSGALSFHVLGPIDTPTPEGPGLRRLDSKNSQNTNGHSVLLRVDFGDTRVLLTGDLNKNSQHYLIEHYGSAAPTFAADVAKACHHGSEDVSFEFLAGVKAAVTIISSGDNEKHDHPRPAIVGASGATGFLTLENDEIKTPLVYSTELARAVSLGDPFKLEVPGTDNTTEDITGETFDDTKVVYKEQKPGDLNPRTRARRMGRSYVVAGQVYGLVNVRTDGSRILCATMNEGKGTWEIKTLHGRF